MTDLVHYEIPFGWMGNLLGGRMVARRVAAIFAYRRKMLAKLFGTLEE
jgi:ligand-binding SRPBCC domain-containing protein